jgi:hypothetical protein
MTPYTADMTQAATYWPPTGADAFGTTTHGTAVAIMCRWQDRAVLFRDIDGQEMTSSAIVYPDRALAPRGQIALGTHAGTPLAAGAKEVRQAGTSPDLDGDEVLHKVWL